MKKNMSPDSEKVFHFREKVVSLIADDNRDGLLELLRSDCGKVGIALWDLDKPPTDLLTFLRYQCILFDAIKCATALLKGETGLNPPDFNHSALIHGAADALSPKMTKYFLELGFPVNVKISSRGTAVDFAIHSIRQRIFWKDGQSYSKLLVKLTGEGMYDPLETLILLMQKLSDSEASEVICRYATEGKTIEVAALLLGLSAKHLSVDKLDMPNNDVSLGGRLTLRQCVVNQIVMLENELSKLLLVGSTKLAECRKRKMDMMSILMLLEIFSRAQDEFAQLVMQLKSPLWRPEIPDAISMVFKASGFTLTGKTADCLRESFPTENCLSYYLQRTRRESLSMIIKQRQQPDKLPDVERYFPSGLPPLGSFATMADIGWDETDPNHERLLTALEQLSSAIKTSDWTPNQSIFKLIAVLCLPEMKQKLDAIRLFAEDIEKVNEIACCYAREGKLIQLAIILMVAWGKVRDPVIVQIKGDNSARCMTFQQFINSELAQAVDLECRLIGRTAEHEKELSKICKERKGAAMSALALVEVFEKADALRSYLSSERSKVQKEVVKDVTELLREAGFKLKSRDIVIDDIVKSSKQAALEQVDGALQDLDKNAETMTKCVPWRQDFTRLSYLLPCGFAERHGAYGRPDVMKNFLLTRYPRESSVWPSAAQSFRALWTSKAYSTSTHKALQVELHKDVVRINWLLEKFPLSKQLASVALAVKRGLKFA